MKKSESKNKKWIKFATNKYIIILVLFLVWMLFFDSNSFLFHKELNEDIKALEDNKENYREDIEKDKSFIEIMKDSTELEKFAREKYYLKKENEDIFIIEHEDSIKAQSKNE